MLTTTRAPTSEHCREHHPSTKRERTQCVRDLHPSQRSPSQPWASASPDAPRRRRQRRHRQADPRQLAHRRPRDVGGRTSSPRSRSRTPASRSSSRPTDTNDYNAAIQSQVEGGTGPDLITCRPFDVNRAWIERRLLRQPDGARRRSTPSPRPLSPPGQATTATPTACPSPPCSPASTTTRRSSTSSASRYRPRRTSSSTCCRRSRTTAPTRRSRSARPTAGSSPTTCSTTSARTTGRARMAGSASSTARKKLTDPDFVAAFQAVRRPASRTCPRATRRSRTTT